MGEAGVDGAVLATAGSLHDPSDLLPIDEDLRSMLLIRHFEQQLLELFAAGLLNGTTHTCLGQEYVPVALRGVLSEDDYEFSNHRGHGHYLARFDDPAGLLAEIMGRDGAICRGVGGSQHLRRDRFLTHGVQGQLVPVAAGVAMHLSRARVREVAVAYVGDGTWGQGVVYEALNMASLWRLPLLIVVENNGIAMSTSTADGLAGSIAGRAAAFGADYVRIASSGVTEIREQLRDPVRRVREGHGPLVIEFETVRVGPHSKGDDTRSPADLSQVREADWYARYARQGSDRFIELDAEQRHRIETIACQVIARPPSEWEVTCTAPSA